MEIAIGFVLGTIGSIIGWWIIDRYLGPRLAISEVISIVPTTKHSWGQPQRFKIMNLRRWRGLAEVRAVARLQIRGLPAAMDVYPHSDLTFEISLSSIDSCVEFVGPREGWIFTLDPQDVVSPYVVFLPSETQTSISNRTALVSDLLDLGEVAALQIFVSATDAYSGSRRTFSKAYTRSDVTWGYFRRGSLECIQVSAGDPAPDQGQ